jgi:hypothetical protein
MNRKIVLLGLLTCLLSATGFAQLITYNDFGPTSNRSGLALNGSAAFAGNNLRLTPSASGQAGSTWFTTKQKVTGGFTTYFEFKLTLQSEPLGADGIAFVIQNSSPCGVECSPTTALGGGGGNLGYEGIAKSLAVEFDTWLNPDFNDPNNNHIAVQSCGAAPNSPVHGACTLGGPVLLAPFLMDGADHHAVVEFNPCTGCGANTGSLDVYMDPPITPGSHTVAPGTTPTLHIAAVNLSDVVDEGGNAFVGFTSATGSAWQQHDLLNWFFTPHTPTTAQKLLANGDTLFFFGQHQLTVTYPSSVPVPPGIDMIVTAIPISPAVFQSTKLPGTGPGGTFAGEECVVYDGTGGNCIIYRVTCVTHGTNIEVTCPQQTSDLTNPAIVVKTSFDGPVLLHPDLLKTDPNGSKNWISIFTSYTIERIDGSSSGHTIGFSDFVATESTDTLPPTFSCDPVPSAWSISDVTLNCTAQDVGGSTLLNPLDASFTLSTSVPAGTQTSNASTGSKELCDALHNCTMAGPISGIKVDKKAPAIALTTPANGGSYIVGSVVNASYSCSDTGGSGVATCVGTVPNGSPIDTSAGPKSFTVNSTDVAGNAAPTVTASYNSTYSIGLLYDPTKAAKSGSTIPIKIYLANAQGQDVSSSGIVLTALQVVKISNSTTSDVLDAGNSNPDSNFRFDSSLGTSGGYIFNLKTTGLSSGTYRLDFKATGDSVTHSVGFAVK